MTSRGCCCVGAADLLYSLFTSLRREGCPITEQEAKYQSKVKEQCKVTRQKDSRPNCAHLRAPSSHLFVHPLNNSVPTCL